MAEESGSTPSRAKERPSTSPSPSTPEQGASPRFNLLLAEDNLPDALLVREAIRMQNLPLDVHLVSDGQKAMEFIERSETDPKAPCPDLILLDINLPRADGFEVLRRVRASDKCGRIPVVVVSSSDSPADRELASELGAGYFRKPPSYAEYLKLGTVLKGLIENRQV